MIDLETELKKPVQAILDTLLDAMDERVLPDEQHGLMVAIDQMVGRLNSIMNRINAYQPIVEPAKSKKK